MFSQGQLLFAVFFVLAFISIMVFSYRKDIRSHKVHYKGSLKILLVFVMSLIGLFLIKYFTQNA
ncbi:MAG: hypothetical protein CND43_03180 [Flavobacteriales bacterium MED-G15]|nr:MAG: hypothetical protein CND43_03180 [Flavobacteriales bacterium MED-G15]